MKKTVIGTGLTGLVGSRIVELNSQYEFIDISYPQADITKIDSIESYFKNHLEAKTVIHFAAFTDTKSAWEQRFDLTGPCFQINVIGTQNIVTLCQKYQKHLIHISTDYVFNGQKETPYTEDDPINSLEWYGQTKAMAEKIALNAGATVARICFPFRQSFAAKADFIQGYINKLKAREPLYLFTDQTITPTFIDDMATAFDVMIQRHPEGIYHVVGSSFHSPFEVAQKVAAAFKLDASLIHESSLAQYLKDNPLARTFGKNQAISNQKLQQDLGVTMKTFEQSLKLLAPQN
jgi:dTDP-4-dehydrorhamnose reductase